MNQCVVQCDVPVVKRNFVGDGEPNVLLFLELVLCIILISKVSILKHIIFVPALPHWPLNFSKKKYNVIFHDMLNSGFPNFEPILLECTFYQLRNCFF